MIASKLKYFIDFVNLNNVIKCNIILRVPSIGYPTISILSKVGKHEFFSDNDIRYTMHLLSYEIIIYIKL